MAIPEAAEISDWTEDGQGDDRPPEPPPAAGPPAGAAARPAAPAAAKPAAPPAPVAEEDTGEVEAVEESRPSRVRVRHRARSQQAGPGDVPRIAQLTRKLRETEAELAKFKQPGGAPASPAAAPGAARPAAPAPAAAELPPVRTPAGPATAQPYDKPEPMLEQFMDKPDPHAAWQRALAAYDRAKERHDEAEAARVARHTEDSATFEAERQQIVDGYRGRLEAFKAITPRFDAALEAAKAHSTSPLMDEAILRHERGPEIVLHLAENPGILDDVFLATAETPVNATTVAVLQRRLSALLAAPASPGTGSAAAPVVPPAPSPPNPVRTGSQTPGDTMPGDDDSLEAHEQYFHEPGRRRRR